VERLNENHYQVCVDLVKTNHHFLELVEVALVEVALVDRQNLDLGRELLVLARHQLLPVLSIAEPLELLELIFELIFLMT
jgi:hypothetical protein